MLDQLFELVEPDDRDSARENGRRSSRWSRLRNSLLPQSERPDSDGATEPDPERKRTSRDRLAELLGDD